MKAFVNKVTMAIACVVVMGGAAAKGEIVVGPWSFLDNAFADYAIQIDEGDVKPFGTPFPGSLNEALAGYSPHQGLINIGRDEGLGNLFQLGFGDLPIRNIPGADLVFFDARFSEDPYAIAVRPEGGAFTSFLTFSETAFVETGEVGPFQGTDLGYLFGLPIDLDDYGLAPWTVVDAIQFQSLFGSAGVGGDPVMAASLVPEPMTLVLLAMGALALTRRRP